VVLGLGQQVVPERRAVQEPAGGEHIGLLGTGGGRLDLRRGQDREVHPLGQRLPVGMRSA
jgi:hypothetical protein